MAKTDKEIVLTKFTSNKILSKEFTLENGEIVKKAAANMTSGHAEMLAMDMEEFVELLPTLKNDEALGFGIHDAERYGHCVAIRTKSNAQPDQGILARTKEYFKYAQGPGVMMLDHDIPVDPDDLVFLLGAMGEPTVTENQKQQLMAASEIEALEVMHDINRTKAMEMYWEYMQDKSYEGDDLNSIESLIAEKEDFLAEDDGAMESLKWYFRTAKKLIE